jgi:3-oxoacyl-[acyl-carrier-protein] synthase II
LEEALLGVHVLLESQLGNVTLGTRSMPIHSRLFLTGVEAVCCLGDDLESIMARVRAGECGLKVLTDFGLPSKRGGWASNRKRMLHQRYGPASALAVDVARRAVTERGWSRQDLADACVFAGSSRGNTAGWFDAWPGRKRRKIYAASNNLHSEIAAAVSIELGIRGASHLLSNGCASGLDALGMAMLHLRHGLAKRAVVVSVDLPLSPSLLASFAESGLLSTNDVNDPYSPRTSGFFPAEAGVALLIESSPKRPLQAWCELAGYWTNSDAYDPIGAEPKGEGLIRCLRSVIHAFPERRIAAICPHANGTPAQAAAEGAALTAVFPGMMHRPSLHLLKPFTGHSLGASGALETAILAHSMREGLLPANLPNLTEPAQGFALPSTALKLSKKELVLNLSVAMGGHNAVLAMMR